MTVLAFDGKCVAADRQGEVGGLCGRVTKIHRVGDLIAGYIGGAAHGLTLVEWLKAGHDPATYPRERDGEARGVLLVFGRGIIRRYEDFPIPVEIDESIWAAGSGGDLAMGALAAGADARRAVEIASRYDAACGLGIDVLELP